MYKKIPIIFEKDEKEIKLFSVDIEDVECLAQLGKLDIKINNLHKINKDDILFKEIIDFLNQCSDSEISSDFNTASLEISKIEKKHHMSIKDFLSVSIDKLRDLQKSHGQKALYLRELNNF